MKKVILLLSVIVSCQHLGVRLTKNQSEGQIKEKRNIASTQAYFSNLSNTNWNSYKARQFLYEIINNKGLFSAFHRKQEKYEIFTDVLKNLVNFHHSTIL